MAARVCLVVIPSADETLCNLGTFAFVALNLLYVGGRHLSSVANILRLIERLEDIHTNMQGMISSSHLAMALFHDVLLWWSQYLNMCMMALASKHRW